MEDTQYTTLTTTLFHRQLRVALCQDEGFLFPIKDLLTAFKLHDAFSVERRSACLHGEHVELITEDGAYFVAGHCARGRTTMDLVLLDGILPQALTARTMDGLSNDPPARTRQRILAAYARLQLHWAHATNRGIMPPRMAKLERQFVTAYPWAKPAHTAQEFYSGRWEMSPFATFMRDSVSEINDTTKRPILLTSLLQAYKGWCQAKDLPCDASSSRKLTMMLSHLGIKTTRDSANRGIIRGAIIKQHPHYQLNPGHPLTGG